MNFLKYYTFLSALSIALASQAQSTQIKDDFSDGDFTQSPVWVGDVSNFVVNTAGELQLTAPTEGVSALFTQGSIPDSNIWDLHFRLAFAPSTSNALKIILWSSSTDLNTANAYWLEVGETGSADALRLFRADAGAKKLLATGVAGLVGTDPVAIHLRMTRRNSGLWSLEAAQEGLPLQPQFEVSDAVYSGSSNAYFGFQCTYTETRKEHFFFDDIKLDGFVIADTQAPQLLSLIVEDEQHLRLNFNEKMAQTSVENTANYNISNGVGTPQNAVLQADGQSLRLSLATALLTGDYTLNATGAKDLAGNAMATQSVPFNFIKFEEAGEFDLIINEIMYIPNPGLGLPEFEWVEIYNRSSKYIQMSNIRIQDGAADPQALPEYAAAPGEYIVLVAKANADSLRKVIGGTVIGMSLSSSALNNTGDLITLTNLNGIVLDQVNYRPDWHTINGKGGGGWSLERINPETPCIGKENWQSCPLLPGPGGTPGKKNAAFNNEPDEINPEFVLAVPYDPGTIVVHFSEGLNTSVLSETFFSISPQVGITAVQFNPENRAQILLYLATPLQKGIAYTLTLSQSIEDCSGNPLRASVNTPLGLPEKPAPGDIVINEVLFNPPSGGVRYIEFYNRSQKLFNWSDFILRNTKTGPDLNAIDDEKITAFRLFLPGTYEVLTPGREDVALRHKNIEENRLIYQELPSMDNKEGTVILLWQGNNSLITIDSFDYLEAYHNALFSISDRDGVALERISIMSPTQAPSNWTSASSIRTGAPGTPTLPNSQMLPEGANKDSALIFLPVARISPHEIDGKDDFLDIQYKLPREGYAASFYIFDADGQPVKRLVRQELIGTEGHLRWDGDASDGSLARPGIYVLFAEVYSPDGDVQRVKKTVSVVRMW